MHMPNTSGREESVHLERFPAVADVEALIDRNLLNTWEHLLRLRGTVNASLELLRKNKEIGTSLEAKVHITASGDDLRLLERYQRQLPMLFIVSDVSFAPGDPAIHVNRAPGVKCERCWRYVSKMSTDPAQAGICDRCQDALAETDAA
jgi:isoleucyl-tRNA synthetase